MSGALITPPRISALRRRCRPCSRPAPCSSRLPLSSRRPRLCRRCTRARGCVAAQQDLAPRAIFRDASRDRSTLRRREYRALTSEPLSASTATRGMRKSACPLPSASAKMPMRRASSPGRAGRDASARPRRTDARVVIARTGSVLGVGSGGCSLAGASHRHAIDGDHQREQRPRRRAARVRPRCARRARKSVPCCHSSWGSHGAFRIIGASLLSGALD